MTKLNISALQMGTSPEGTAATLDAILSFEPGIADSGSSLVVMPEALLGGYPKGENFGTPVGYRQPEGRERFARYYADAIDVPGPQTEAISALSMRTNAYLVIGAIERAGSTLYCSALTFSPEHGLMARRRKLMSTGAERLIWGHGSGADLVVANTDIGAIGAAICWENYMPLLRSALYAKGVKFWCAPTVDDRELWQATMRHIAAEGRCFVISACQVQPSPNVLGVEAPGRERDKPLIHGGSVIVSPLGDVLAGPVYDETLLLTAQIDLEDIVRARYDFDVVGHYSRPDIFRLTVDQRDGRSVDLGDVGFA